MALRQSTPPSYRDLTTPISWTRQDSLAGWWRSNRQRERSLTSLMARLKLPRASRTVADSCFLLLIPELYPFRGGMRLHRPRRRGGRMHVCAAMRSQRRRRGRDPRCVIDDCELADKAEESGQSG